MWKLMTKKIIALALAVVMLSMTAFAAEKAPVDSIYAADAEQIAAAVEDTMREEFNTAVDEETVMPVYEASLYDFAKTGAFDMAPMDAEEGPIYVSDVVDADGNFAGTALFAAGENGSEVLMYAPGTDRAASVDFRANSSRVNSLMKKRSVSTENMTAKFAFVDGLGYVYYINSGNEEVLIAAGLKGTNGNVFTEENGGIVVVDDEFKKLALAELAEYEKRMEALSQLAPGENPETGGDMPVFMVENTTFVQAGRYVSHFIVAAVLVGLGICLMVRSEKRRGK